MKVTNLRQKLGWLAGLAAIAGPAMLPTNVGPMGSVAHAQQPTAPTQPSATQAPSNPTPQQAYDYLLTQARAAMRAGDWQAADYFVAEAEKVPYQPKDLVARLNDTTSKVRQDLEVARRTPVPPAVANAANRDLAQAEQAARKAREALAAGNMPAAVGSFAEAAAKAGQHPALAGQLQQLHQDLQSKGANAKDIATAVSNYRPLPTAPQPGQGPQLPTVPALGQLAGTPAPQGTPTGTAPVSPLRSGAPVPQLATPNNAVVPAGVMATTPQAGTPVSPGAFQGVYNPQLDQSRVTQVGSQDGSSPTGNASGEQLYEQGIEALSTGNRELALQRFSEAWRFEAQMDPGVRNQLREKLMLLRTPQPAANQGALPQGGETLDAASQEEAALRQKLYREVTGEISASERTSESDPLGSLQRLNSLRIRVAQSDVENSTKKQFLAMVDRAINAQQAFIDQNRSNIEQDQRNRQILAEMDAEREKRAKIDQEIASLVEQYNDLRDQRRYEEMEIIAKQVMELDPNSQIAVTLYQNAKLARRIYEVQDIKNLREEKYADAMNSVEEALIPFDDRNPLQWTDAKTWDAIRNMRKGENDRIVKMSESERAIYGKLKAPVSVQFNNKPLAEAMFALGEMVGIPVHIDPLGLSAEALPSDQTVSLNLVAPVSLESALNLLLEPLNLGYTVKDDVLTITSKDRIRRNIVTQPYNVKDLVLPIPNFVADYNLGMAGALQSALQTQGNRLLVQTNETSPMQLASSKSSSVNPNSPVLAQMGGMMPGMGGMPGAGMGMMPMMGGAPGMGMMPGGMSGMPGVGPGMSPGLGSTPGAMGGATAADFSQLISLIMQTVDPDLWEQGDATIQPYPGNLSLVVSAPQETHEEIQDLLEALRALQNVQVTIEVRFITLGDNFFERIGVDFDFKIDDNVTSLPLEDQGPSVTVGIDRTGQPTADLDLAFSQDSFNSTIPQIGGYTGSTAASFGFAILSDIEMFFFLEAAQGDTRTNVLQAPKVTLYDGQFASIFDITQRPFVVSLIPVVGTFAVAQQPVIVVLNEGTQLNVQAVVSPDKKFVRLTLMPNFTQIGDVTTFTFEGKKTSNNGTTVRDQNNKPTTTKDNTEEIVEGTTVQQPSFSITNVSTSVNVPDGGTILLGGIKRLRENRIERGVPMLSKIPYINRLFKNVGIGRETNTFMMTVTPRIIIREEEEERQAGVSP